MRKDGGEHAAAALGVTGEGGSRGRPFGELEDEDVSEREKTREGKGKG